MIFTQDPSLFGKAFADPLAASEHATTQGVKKEVLGDSGEVAPEQLPKAIGGD